jgi:hypothetical protein
MEVNRKSHTEPVTGLSFTLTHKNELTVTVGHVPFELATISRATTLPSAQPKQLEQSVQDLRHHRIPTPRLPIVYKEPVSDTLHPMASINTRLWVRNAAASLLDRL